jgi:cupin fold WbuC family metalloprotein
MNYDLRDSKEDESQRMLNAIEPGTVIPIHRHTGTSEDVIILRGEQKRYSLMTKEMRLTVGFLFPAATHLPFMFP